MSVSLDVHRLGRLRWIVLNGPGREAVIAVRDDQPIAIPLGDLAEGNPYARLFPRCPPGRAATTLTTAFAPTSA